MAQTVSELWTQLWNTSNTKREYAFDIEGVWYEQNDDAEVEHNVESSLYSDFGIGNAAESTLSLSLYADDIPRAAQIKRYTRLVNGDQTSEWLPKGVFWANRRPNDDGYWTVEAVDAMHKADVVWEPDQSLEFPMPMTEAVEIIAALMGVEIDPRTVLNAEYTIDYPVSKQTFRKTLAWIAAAHGGNFVMTDEGKLLLVPLISAPAETSYLVDESGDPILIGGTQILVDDATSELGNADGAKHYVGLDIIGFTNNGKYKPVSRVTLLLDDENALTAGDDTGFELVADCPYATQEMVDALLAALKGYEYQAYVADEANIDPAAELGDGVTVNGIYSVIAKISDDGRGYPSLAAPGKAELEEDLQLGGPMQQEFTRKIAETNSLISKTAEQIRLEVEGKIGEDEANTLISAAIGEITLSVSSAAGGSTFSLTSGEVTISTQTLKLHVDAANIDGKLTASQIDASELKVDAANITGSLVIGQLPEGVATTSDIPSNLSDLNNDAGFITDADIPTKTSDLTNDSGFTDLSSVASYISDQGFQNASGVVSIINGTVTADFINALGVTAAYLKGNVIDIGYGYNTFGYLYPGTNSEDTTALTMTGINGLRLTSGGNVFLRSGGGQQLVLGNGICQLSGGPLVVGADSYGTSLPSTGTYGQVFFLLE